MVESELLLKGRELIKQGINAIADKEYESAKRIFIEAQKDFTVNNSSADISICLSMLGMLEYLINKNNFKNAVSIINDGGYMADFTKNDTAKLFNELALGTVNFGEGSKDVALIHYKNAKETGLKCDEYSMMQVLDARIKQVESGLDFTLPMKSDPLVSLVKIGRSITALTDINVLLKLIAEETKTAIQADRCTVFLLDNEKNELWSMVALGMDSEEIRFPADKGLAGYVVKTGETINIADAYNDSRFNSEVDSKTGYRTKTVLCMPIKNNNQEIIGAFQVINKLEGVFSKNDEDLLIAIGGSASIALENAQLFEQQKELYKEQKELFNSFINTLAASIDARDKITAGHSSRVRDYAMLIANNLELDDKYKEIIEKAAILHDIGKIGIRDSVLQKEGKLTPEEYKHIQEHAQITHDILDNIYMSEEFKHITEFACSHHEKYDGSGYYRQLKGKEIPYGGRILAVSDVFDAITSKRHYRDKMPIGNVIKILINDSWKHFDGDIVDVFLKISLDRIVEVFLTETHNNLTPQDRELLKHYNLRDIYNYINEENKTDEQKKLLEMFNYYYSPDALIKQEEPQN